MITAKGIRRSDHPFLQKDSPLCRLESGAGRIGGLNGTGIQGLVSIMFHLQMIFPPVLTGK